MSTVRLRDGSEVGLRPLAADDGERLRRLFLRLSPTSVYRRFRSPIPAPRPASIARLLDIDHCNREALAAVIGDEVVGIVRYARLEAESEAELAVVVEDAWQHRGLGAALTRRLAAVARRRGVRAFRAHLLGENVAAIRLLRGLSPAARMWWDEGEIQAEIPLSASRPEPTPGRIRSAETAALSGHPA